MKTLIAINNLDVASKLKLHQTNICFQTFSDGEIKAELEQSVREKRVFVLGSLRTSDDIMKFLMCVDAIKRDAARSVIAIIPYIPYMRQDRKDTHRCNIGAKVIADIIQNSGIDQLITFDLHANQIEGFFDIPVTHIDGFYVFKDALSKHIVRSEFMVVSPDVGGAKRANRFASQLGLPLAIINKHREVANQISSMELMGDVTNKHVLLVDDMVDTAGSLVKASELLLSSGAKSVSAVITHGVLSGDAYINLKRSKIQTVYISNTLSIDGDNMSGFESVCISGVLNKVLYSIENGVSISENLNR